MPKSVSITYLVKNRSSSNSLSLKLPCVNESNFKNSFLFHRMYLILYVMNVCNVNVTKVCK